MYMEEDILFYILHKNGHSTLYSNEISVLHMEDSATNYSYENDRLRQIFKCKNIIKSSLVLIGLMKRRRFDL